MWLCSPSKALLYFLRVQVFVFRIRISCLLVIRAFCIFPSPTVPPHFSPATISTLPSFLSPFKIKYYATLSLRLPLKLSLLAYFALWIFFLNQSYWTFTYKNLKNRSRVAVKILLLIINKRYIIMNYKNNNENESVNNLFFIFFSLTEAGNVGEKKLVDRRRWQFNFFFFFYDEGKGSKGFLRHLEHLADLARQ